MGRGLVECPALAGPETSWWAKNINMVHLKGVLKNPLARAGIVVKIPRQRRGRFFRLWRNPGDPHESDSGIPIPEPT